MLKPVDVAMTLKLSLMEGVRAPYRAIAGELHLSLAEVYNSVKRCTASGLVYGHHVHDPVNRTGLLEFLLHGLRYSFPAEKGEPTRGVPTSYAAEPLSRTIRAGTEPVPVWPYAKGTVRGYGLTPLYKGAPQAALEDPAFYELLALADALRDGRARERDLAATELRKRLEK